MKRLMLGVCVLALFAACESGTTLKKFLPDNDQIAGGDDLLNDDGQLINDDGQLINDDGQLINDDGQIINDDGQVITDDDEWPDGEWPDGYDGEWPDGSDGEWPDWSDGEWPDGSDGEWPDGSDGEWPDGSDGEWPDWSDGEWPDDDMVNSCGTDDNCGETEYCAKPAGTCEAYLAGTCEVRPEMCPPVYSPVCGCDGQTYGSECDAHAAGVNVDFAGECGTTPGCYSNEECASSGSTPQFCLYEVGACYGPGTCTDYPGICGDIYSPVCGCDYQTYQNDCMAYSAGVSVMYEGECKEEKYSTLSFYYDQGTMNAPEAMVVVVNGDETIEFPTADLMTRTTFGSWPNNGVYFRTTFYGTTDDGSKIEFQLKVLSSSWTLPNNPYVTTLDGADNYARWTKVGNVVMGDLSGEVTITQYARDGDIITLMNVSGDYLTFVPN